MADPLQDLPSEIQGHRILDSAQAASLCGYSVSQWRTLYRHGRVPKPIELSARRYGWKFKTLVSWLNEKAAASGIADDDGNEPSPTTPEAKAA